MRAKARESGATGMGDPKKGAQAILQIAEVETPPLRLLLGSDAYALARDADEAKIAADEEWKELHLLHRQRRRPTATRGAAPPGRHQHARRELAEHRRAPITPETLIDGSVVFSLRGKARWPALISTTSGVSLAAVGTSGAAKLIGGGSP
jgi:hypothetical protein